jgi:hypothetical protein
MVVAMLLIAVAHLDACTPAARERNVDDWANDPRPSMIDGDLDAAEMRWRKEIEASRAGEDRLLTDDPPGAPSSYGKVASSDGAEAAETEDPPPPATFWGRFKAGADTFGKASFAALTVVVTLGMMAAPYLIPAV